jgi:hypothetical protein
MVRAGATSVGRFLCGQTSTVSLAIGTSLWCGAKHLPGPWCVQDLAIFAREFSTHAPVPRPSINNRSKVSASRIGFRRQFNKLRLQRDTRVRLSPRIAFRVMHG